MYKGRGSAIAVAVMVVFLAAVAADAATFTVGATGGWTFNVATWPKGKIFKAGDTLVFNYDATVHNVVAVNKAGYNSCVTPRGSKLYKSGKDQIKLAKGTNYFICGFTGHCQSGMKLAVTAR